MFPYYRRFDLDISQPNQTYSKEFELENSVKKVEAILLDSDNDAMLYYRGTQALYFNGTEYFPDNFGSKLLMSGLDCPPNHRYFKLDNAQIINGKIKIVYTDLDNVGAPFTPYKVFLYVEAMREDIK